MSKRNLIWLAILALLVAAVYRLTPMAARQDAVYRTYAPLVEVDSLIRQKFVEPVPGDRLVEGAIRGMMLKLDPYSGYIAPEELDAFRRIASGKYTGIGVMLGVRGGRLTVIAPIEQSPAVQAGVRADDVIQAIDGRSTEGLSVADVDRLLTGAPGSTVRLTVLHPSSDLTETVAIARAPISVHTVKGMRHDGAGDWDYLIEHDPDVAYIRVAAFHDNTSFEFDRALEGLVSAGAAGLILDLRFNPGGSLPAAVAVVDRFISEGTIVSTVTRDQANDRYKARAEDTIGPIPLAVLINGNSASAAEIVAGALQDHRRAVIVGTRSFGKGVVQSVVPLHGQRAAVSLTVAHYCLPNGRVIHKTPQNAHSGEWGVVPDLVVEITPSETDAITSRRNELDQVPSSPTTAPTTQNAQPGTATPPLEILMDRQLFAALQAVRARIEVPLRSDAAHTLGPEDRTGDEADD
ncbi:MAG TPA: S41 family peptidase [Phycisphaerae bacterium]|nr:S41 family peptidase [Phycisphaerae bacterium]